jgi:hypothetical protein
MGVNYRAILAVGKEFDSKQEAFDFLDSHKLMSAEDIEYYEDDGSLEECLPCNMDGGCLNYYSGYGFYVGYRIRCNDPESFRKDFEEGLSNWGKAFGGDVPAEVIHFVQVS